MGLSTIQWTDYTWNIARGCKKVDEDCKYCYMYRDSFNDSRYDPKQIIRTKTVFDMPLKIGRGTKSNCWDGPPLVFTCSLTDFFIEEIDSYRHEAWDIIRKCPHLIFQILTKRPERILQCLPEDWGNGWNNVWLGTSCGGLNGLTRVTELSIVKAMRKCKVAFLSLEPLHQRLQFDPIELKYIDWIICGGESGNEVGKYRYRPCKVEWLEEIVLAGKKNNVPVFVKQLGTHLFHELGLTDRHGGAIDEFPLSLQVREFPNI